jgi:membrane protease YdiL (CAAX protease family)
LKQIPSEWRTILWIVLPIYLLANFYLFAIGTSITMLVLPFAYAVYLIILTWLTVRVTNPMPEDEAQSTQKKSMIWAQIGVLGIIILLTGFRSENIPLWSGMVDWFFNLGESLLPAEWFGGPGNAVANPVQYFVIPFLLLLLLGAKPAELGFGRGNKVWKACLVWIALPAVIFSVLLASGMLPAQTLLRRIIGNTFQNGFFEEFLFRGALQTRLRNVISTPWALTLQAFLFGLWHLRANAQMMDGNVLAALAFCITSQTVAGFVFGFVYHRTRNLLAPSVAHVITNVLGQSF